MLLIKNVDVYTPEHIGQKDVLIAGGKIEYIANEINTPEVPCEVIDATNYPDMQKLLLEASALVSDYSSCMFDYALLKRPCFIFANDILAYKNDRDFYFDLKDLPFSVAENNDELETNILKFNQKQFEKIIIMQYECVGIGVVKMTVGIRRRTQEKVQYCITALDV